MVPSGFVRDGRHDVVDDDWGSVLSVISLDRERFGPDALAGLEEFSHVEIVFVFDRVDENSINVGARHPRGRRDWPMVGIFAQRAKARPNRIGVTTSELVSVDGLDVSVRGLDAVDGTPVLDIKPYVVEFGPRSDVHQPDWISELMTGYW